VALGVATVASVGLGAAATACGVPAHSRAERIDAGKVPFGLAAPSPTTTSSTIPPPDSGILTSGDITEGVTLYFPAGPHFVAVNRTLGAPLTLNAVVDALTKGPRPEDLAASARSVIGEGDVERVTSRGGVAIVQLGAKFPELPPSEQSLGVAQLVLTLTDRPGIGQVSFMLNGQPADVPRANGTLDRGPLSHDDYAALLG
jgi:hypothetical protein